MSTITPTQLIESPGLSESIPSALYRMPLQRYEAMVESGVFTKRDKLHLIDGYLVAKMTQRDPHSTVDDLCRDQLAGVVPAGWYVRSNKPVRIPPRSKPEPDHAVVRGKVRDYSRRSPEPADVALVVEIAESSLTDDRKLMALVYGNAGIPIYWIVNLVDRQVEVYTVPHADGYASREVYLPGSFVPVVVEGQIVGQTAVDDMLP
jgi:Uma2 family endonuclease